MSDESWRGKVGSMDSSEVAAFLDEPIFARLATLDSDGWPYVVPCWQEWSDGRFWVVARKKSAWAGYLVADPRCAVTVDETGGQRKVIAQCRAALVEEPNVGGRWVEIARRMSTRYLGEHGPDYLEPTLNSPRWLFALEPVNVWTWQGNDWAPRYRES
jgi:pyridoxamine 5'-phosphate oxidase-like protein